jgi:hypothetical protein
MQEDGVICATALRECHKRFQKIVGPVLVVEKTLPRIPKYAVL